MTTSKHIDNLPRPVLVNDNFLKHIAQEIPDEEIAAIAHYVAPFK